MIDSSTVLEFRQAHGLVLIFRRQVPVIEPITVPVPDGVDRRECWEFLPRSENKREAAIVTDLLLLGVRLFPLIEGPTLIIPLEKSDIRLNSEIPLADRLEVGKNGETVRTNVMRLEFVEFQHT